MRMSYPSTEGLSTNSPEIEIAESGTILDSKGKFNDLKTMLDSSKENVKMDAMRRIISMVARGKDVSELFPAVVKNVAAKNLELKKLVYVYLVRYAEEQQDLALLSISTFQRGLKDPNQLIRASALRVLSSIRVQMIAPVMMLAIRDSVRDMSPYVRKVAAHAIPKLFVLDAELHPQLIECIDFLLGDKRTLVLGSAVYAFERTCPDRLDLLHRHFRLLCRALADVDEWGQIVMIGLLTRYARTQFLAPIDNYSSGSGRTSSCLTNRRSSDEESGGGDNTNSPMHRQKIQQPLDPDHNLLIFAVRPLLQSRNPAVVMAVAQLLYYIAPFAQLSAAVPRALVRLLRDTNEVQYIVLVNIASIICSDNNNRWEEEKKRKEKVTTNNDGGRGGENSTKMLETGESVENNKSLFVPFLKSFFVRSSDTIHVKQFKLKVLTSLVDESNVQLVIRELQAYMQMSELAEAAVEAIGRCALQVPSAASETCLATLVRLISEPNTSEEIVCVAVVVLKRLLHSDAPLPLLNRVFRLMENVKAPSARACILWLIGMHIGKVPKLAPDLLRKVAKTFADEADIVKLQTLNLAVRIWIDECADIDGKSIGRNVQSAGCSAKCALLVDYIFKLARYDRSYDIRDRCRFLRNMLFSNSTSTIHQTAKIFDDNFENATSKEDGIEEENVQKVDDECDESLTAMMKKGVMNGNAEEPSVKFPYEIFLSERPAPSIHNSFADRIEHFQLGTLSHLLNQKCNGYTPLPDFPTEQPDPTIRRSAYPLPTDSITESSSSAKHAKTVASEELELGEYESVESGSDEDEEDDEDEDEEDEDEDEEEDEEESSGEESGDEEEEEEDESDQKQRVQNHSKEQINTSTHTPQSRQEEKKHGKTAASAATDLLLLDFDFGPPSIVTAAPSSSTTTSAELSAAVVQHSRWRRAPAQWSSSEFPLNIVAPIMSGGLTLTGRFCRSPCLYSSSMVCLELQICFRHVSLRSTDVHLVPTENSSIKTTGSISVTGLGESERRRITVGIDFGDTARSSEWTVKWANGEIRVNFEVQAPYGEQIEAVDISEADFVAQRSKLVGMNRLRVGGVRRIASEAQLARELYKACNCKQVPGLNHCFAAQTVSHKVLVLISFLGEEQVVGDEGQQHSSSSNQTSWSLQINCENIAFSSMLAQELLQHFSA